MWYVTSLIYSPRVTAILLLLAFSFSAQSQTTYTWSVSGTGSWTTAANWSPARTTTAANDILFFNSGTSLTVTNIPTQSIGVLQVTNNTNLTLQFAAAGNTLTINGLPSTPDLNIDAGAALINNGANAGTIFLATGATATVAGNMSFSNAAHRLDAADAGAIQFNSPSIFTQDAGCSGSVFNSSGTANVVVFTAGSTFLQKAGANPFALTQPASKVKFNTGSLFKLQQSLFPSLSGRTYADFEVDFAGFNQSATGVNALTINSITITQGTLSLNLTGGINLKGDINVAAGQTLNFNPASANTLFFNGTNPQHISNLGTINFGNNENVEFNNSAGIAINNDITLNRTINFRSGVVTVTNPATLICGATATVTSASNTSFVDGLVKKVGNTAFTFPVGATGIGYVPLDITAPTLATDAYVGAYKRISSTTLGGSYPPGLDHTSGVDYWTLSRTSGSSAVDVTLHWTNQSSGNGGALFINDINKLVAVQHNGTTWNSYGGTFNAGSGFAAGSITWPAVNSFGSFALGSTDPTNPLAIHQVDVFPVIRNRPASNLYLKIISAQPIATNAGLQITVPVKIAAQIQLFDVTGHLVYSRQEVLQKNSANYIIPTASLPAGMYYVTVLSAIGDKAAVTLMKK